MKTIGILAGMSWQSSVIYYQELNLAIQKKLGANHSAKIVMYSVDFAPIVKLQHENKWQEIKNILIDAAKKVEKAGADFLLIATNTMHKLAEDINEAINIPIVHIADEVGQAISNDNINTVGLLATSFTMREDFYKDYLLNNYNINTIVPQQKDIKIVHNVIYNELCLGNVLTSSREEYLRIIDNLVSKGAEGIILGCTEIPMLLTKSHSKVKMYDSTKLHINKAIELALV